MHRLPHGTRTSPARPWPASDPLASPRRDPSVPLHLLLPHRAPPSPWVLATRSVPSSSWVLALSQLLFYPIFRSPLRCQHCPCPRSGPATAWALRTSPAQPSGQLAPRGIPRSAARGHTALSTPALPPSGRALSRTAPHRPHRPPHCPRRPRTVPAAPCTAPAGPHRSPPCPRHPRRPARCCGNPGC